MCLLFPFVKTLFGIITKYYCLKKTKGCKVSSGTVKVFQFSALLLPRKLKPILMDTHHKKYIKSRQ